MYAHTYLDHGYSTIQPSYFPVPGQPDYHTMPQQLPPTLISQSSSSIPHRPYNRSSFTASTSSQLSGATQYNGPRRRSEYTHSEPIPRKRSRADGFHSDAQKPPVYCTSLALDSPGQFGLHGQQPQSNPSSYPFQPRQLPRLSSIERSPQSDTPQSQLQHSYSPSQPPQIVQHHHHHLPAQSPLTKRSKHVAESASALDLGSPSMVGREGMPEPAPRPKGPKLKFTREDDALLIRLKETKNLTWKQISDFFPGRSAGTLQVRYCTKLKAKTTLWNDDMVSWLFSLIFFLHVLKHAHRRMRQCRNVGQPHVKTCVPLTPTPWIIHMQTDYRRHYLSGWSMPDMHGWCFVTHGCFNVSVARTTDTFRHTLQNTPSRQQV